MNTGDLWPDADTARRRVLKIQTKLHQWASDDPDRRFDDLFNLVHDPAVLVDAWQRVLGNRGARSAGVDGQIAYYIKAVRGEQAFLSELRDLLKARSFHPDPVREVMIPKPGGRRRRLGIATVRDRVVQAALKTPQDGARADLRDGFPTVQLRVPSTTPRPGRDRRDSLSDQPLL